MSFFLEYSNMLVVVLSIVGLLLGLLMGYCFWGSYSRRKIQSEKDIVDLENEIDSLQDAHRHMKNELAARA